MPRTYYDDNFGHWHDTDDPDVQDFYHQTITDPTRTELLAVAADVAATDEFDREEGCYWFAADYHGGQWSNLYVALCASPFKPSILSNGPDNEQSREVYAALESAFAGRRGG